MTPDVWLQKGYEEVDCKIHIRSCGFHSWQCCDALTLPDGRWFSSASITWATAFANLHLPWRISTYAPKNTLTDSPNHTVFLESIEPPFVLSGPTGNDTCHAVSPLITVGVCSVQ